MRRTSFALFVIGIGISRRDPPVHRPRGAPATSRAALRRPILHDRPRGKPLVDASAPGNTTSRRPLLRPYDAGIFRMRRPGTDPTAVVVGRVDLALGIPSTTCAGARCARLQQHGRDANAGRPDRLASTPRQPVLDTPPRTDRQHPVRQVRVAPNQEARGPLRVAEHYKRYVDTTTGSSSSLGGQKHSVPRYTRRGGSPASILPDEMPVERLSLSGAVPDIEAATYYRNADALRLAERSNEGLLLPLVAGRCRPTSRSGLRRGQSRCPIPGRRGNLLHTQGPGVLGRICLGSWVR